MTPKDKKRFDDMSSKDKVRYDREMAHYVPSGDAGAKGGKRKKKDPNAPKRALYVMAILICIYHFALRLCYLVVVLC